MHASPDMTDVLLLPRRRRKYRIPMLGACLTLVLLMFWSTDNAAFRAGAIILALGIYAAYWYQISWPAVTAVVCAVGFVAYAPSFEIGNYDPPTRTQCANHMRQISLALYAYHSTHGQYPPLYTTNAEGEPLLSWRVLILPYLERRDLYEQFQLDEPWNSPHNRPLARRMPEWFRCPTAGSPELTSYLAVVGDETVWRPEGGISYRDIPERRLSTGLLIEDPFSDVIWTQPADLSLESEDWRIQRLLRMSNEEGHHGGLHVALTTGEIKFVSKRSLTAKKLRSLFTAPDDGIPR